jgi:hypothetical protein
MMQDEASYRSPRTRLPFVPFSALFPQAHTHTQPLLPPPPLSTHHAALRPGWRRPLEAVDSNTRDQGHGSRSSCYKRCSRGLNVTALPDVMQPPTRLQLVVERQGRAQHGPKNGECLWQVTCTWASQICLVHAATSVHAATPGAGATRTCLLVVLVLSHPVLQACVQSLCPQADPVWKTVPSLPSTTHTHTYKDTPHTPH